MALRETSTNIHVGFVLFNQTCLLVHWKSKRKATLPLPSYQTCQLTIINFISQDCYIVNTTYMPCRELFATYMPAGLVLLSPTTLLFKHAYWLSAAARWMLAGLCLLLWCLTINRACWRGASLKVMPFDLVPHYQPCLLVWCLTIGNAFWCGASL